jgi:hypothetical protein
MKTIRRRESPPPPSYQYQSGDFQMNLTNIKTASGKSFTVNAEAAPLFKAFVDELEGRGYKINDIGGFSPRNEIYQNRQKAMNACSHR